MIIEPPSKKAPLVWKPVDSLEAPPVIYHLVPKNYDRSRCQCPLIRGEVFRETYPDLEGEEFQVDTKPVHSDKTHTVIVQYDPQTDEYHKPLIFVSKTWKPESQRWCLELYDPDRECTFYCPFPSRRKVYYSTVWNKRVKLIMEECTRYGIDFDTAWEQVLKSDQKWKQEMDRVQDAYSDMLVEFEFKDLNV